VQRKIVGLGLQIEKLLWALREKKTRQIKKGKRRQKKEIETHYLRQFYIIVSINKWDKQ